LAASGAIGEIPATLLPRRTVWAYRPARRTAVLACSQQSAEVIGGGFEIGLFLFDEDQLCHCSEVDRKDALTAITLFVTPSSLFQSALDESDVS
jgi:hypothetical protein